MKTDCIIWNGKTCAQGRYGYIGSPLRLAHRDAWINKNGAIPKGIFVCHHCDNGLCVNVEHLFLGTNSDNQKDSVTKGRHKGFLSNQKKTNNANNKYSEQLINDIRLFKLKNPTYSYEKIRNEFNLKSKGYVWNIINNKIWS